MLKKPWSGRAEVLSTQPNCLAQALHTTQGTATIGNKDLNLKRKTQLGTAACLHWGCSQAATSSKTHSTLWTHFSATLWVGQGTLVPSSAMCLSSKGRRGLPACRSLLWKEALWIEMCSQVKSGENHLGLGREPCAATASFSLGYQLPRSQSSALLTNCDRSLVETPAVPQGSADGPRRGHSPPRTKQGKEHF